jgi:hypothetical protein
MEFPMQFPLIARDKDTGDDLWLVSATDMTQGRIYWHDPENGQPLVGFDASRVVIVGEDE